MKRILLFTAVLTILFLTSCGSKKRTTSTQTKRTTTVVKKPVKRTPPKHIPVVKVPKADAIVEDLRKKKPNLNKAILAYIKEYNDIAIAEMLQYKIPASITIAQGILESNSGRGRLAVKANNHFGIKCHKSWKGRRIYHDDDARQECFRNYDHPLSSFRDHSDFLYGRKRYANLFKLRLKDYKGWARGLKKAGYATDPKYPKKLISLIERYELYRFDDFNEKYAGGVTKISKKKTPKDTKQVIVKKGDTLYSIATKHNMTVDRLKWLNGIKTNNLDIGQKLLVEK